MIKQLFFLFLACFAVSMGAVSVQAADEVVEFSADAIQKSPQAPPMQAKMFVGNKRVRKEYEANGQEYVEIFDANKQHAVLLMPRQHTYMEQTGPAAPLQGNSGEKRSPCDGVNGASCKKLGRESVHGRPADKWEMVIQGKGGDRRALYWLDADRGMLLKQILPDGTSTEMRMLSMETVNGRQTEKWEMTASNPNGQTLRSLQWYDPKLKIAIREEMPGGYTRELKNITVGAQASDLFEIPAGYTLVKNPQSASGTPRPPAGMMR